MWTFWGVGGEWDYYLAQTPWELFQECRQYSGGCATSDREMWVLESNRYMPSTYSCLTVEDHEFAHAVADWSHEDMDEKCKEWRLKHPEVKSYSISSNPAHILYWEQRG